MPTLADAPADDSTAIDPATGLQAALWDMDGTIIDTEPYWIAAEKRLVEEHGGTWTDADARRLVGQALPTSAAMLQDAGVRLDVRSIIDVLSASVRADVAHRTPWRPGARELLADLRAHGVPCVLVTMSEAPLAGAVASALPPGTFRFLVTGDAVRRGKPDPEPYLAALRGLEPEVPGLVARRAVAIEDSAPGIASAVASGATTIGVPNVGAVPEPGGWTRWRTLAGATAADLDALVRAGGRA